MKAEPGGLRNQRRLRAALARYGATQAELAARLTAVGQPTTQKQIESWLASPQSSNYRTCPAWPHLLLENGVLWHHNQKRQPRR